jgi:hypothetical protein
MVFTHKVYRVPGFFSRQLSELGPPAPSSPSGCCSPFGSGGGGERTHSLGREGAGGSHSDEGTDTLVLYDVHTVRTGH